MGWGENAIGIGLSADGAKMDRMPVRIGCTTNVDRSSRKVVRAPFHRPIQPSLPRTTARIISMTPPLTTTGIMNSGRVLVSSRRSGTT